MSDPRAGEVQVRLGWSNEDGGCNGCTRHTDVEFDGGRYRVVRISLRGTEVRACRSCAAELKSLLAGVFR